MLIPERREHSLSERQVPDSSWSLWQAVFWKRSKLTSAAMEGPVRWPETLVAPNRPARLSARSSKLRARAIFVVSFYFLTRYYSLAGVPMRSSCSCFSLTMDSCERPVGRRFWPDDWSVG